MEQQSPPPQYFSLNATCVPSTYRIHIIKHIWTRPSEIIKSEKNCDSKRLMPDHRHPPPTDDGVCRSTVVTRIQNNHSLVRRIRHRVRGFSLRVCRFKVDRDHRGCFRSGENVTSAEQQSEWPGTSTRGRRKTYNCDQRPTTTLTQTRLVPLPVPVKVRQRGIKRKK